MAGPGKSVVGEFLTGQQSPTMNGVEFGATALVQTHSLVV